MKKICILFCLLFFTIVADAQLKGVIDRMKNRSKEKGNQKINQTADNTVDSAFSKSERTVKDVAKDITTKDTTKKDDAATESNTNDNGSSAASRPSTLKAYSKYDFVPGEKIIVYEDFMQDAIGDLPDKWNTNAAGETVTLDGKPGHWFMLTKSGVFMPDFIDSLPENFTLEFDVLADAPVHSWGITVAIGELKDRDKPEEWRGAVNSFALTLIPGTDGNGSCYYERIKNQSGEAGANAMISHFKDVTKPVHISFWRQKERFRVYLDQDKTWDVPKAVLPEAKLNSLVFAITGTDKWNFLIGNLRLATGAPDTRKKILEQNKWVTHGILFDVNSANIKPESYGTLKEMANVLKEYADLRVKIVGHTDADGNDASNLDLSQRRAASVKVALAKEFGIDESRMETDGKGESEPIDVNTTPAGKANNRRVEFIKL